LHLGTQFLRAQQARPTPKISRGERPSREAGERLATPSCPAAYCPSVSSGTPMASTNGFQNLGSRAPTCIADKRCQWMIKSNQAKRLLSPRCDRPSCDRHHSKVPAHNKPPVRARTPGREANTHRAGQNVVALAKRLLQRAHAHGTSSISARPCTITGKDTKQERTHPVHGEARLRHGQQRVRVVRHRHVCAQGPTNTQHRVSNTQQWANTHATYR
jgi:hypothetical protein